MPDVRCAGHLLDFAISEEDETHVFRVNPAQEEARHRLRLEIEYDWISF